MALEEALAGCVSAINKLNDNFAKFFAAGGTAATGTGAQRGRPPGTKKVTLDEVKVIAEKVRTAKGKPAAVALIKKHGADSLAELDEKKYASFVGAAEVLLNEAEPEADGEEIDDTL